MLHTCFSFHFFIPWMADVYDLFTIFCCLIFFLLVRLMYVETLFIYRGITKNIFYIFFRKVFLKFVFEKYPQSILFDMQMFAFIIIIINLQKMGKCSINCAFWNVNANYVQGLRLDIDWPRCYVMLVCHLLFTKNGVWFILYGRAIMWYTNTTVSPPKGGANNEKHLTIFFNSVS